MFNFKLPFFKVYELLENGKFKLQEGWDGIKSGYMNTTKLNTSRNQPINLNSQSNQDNKLEASKKSCC